MAKGYVKKMPSISNHQGTANGNPSNTSPHFSWICIYFLKKITSTERNVEESEQLHTVGWKTTWRFLKILKKMELPYDPEIPLLGIH